MEPDFLLNAGDSGYAIALLCRDTAGTVVDLSAATGVKFLMSSIDPGALALIDAAAENEDTSNGTKGLVSYTFADGDTDVPGTYLGLFVVTLPEGVRSFPVSGRLHIRINSVPHES